jgi:PAS domain S-box-containing protein
MSDSLNQNVDHLVSISNSTTDALISINSQGEILAWNKAASIIFQHEPADIIGKNIEIIIPERFRELHHKGIARVNSGGERKVIGKPVQLAGLRKDGTEVPIELTLSEWEKEGAKFYGGIIRDVSERVKMEENIKHSERRFRSVLESANDCIITADAKGTILSWNKAAELIFGYKQSEVVDRSLVMIIPDKFKSAHEEGISRVSQGGEHHVIGQTVELMGLHKSGREFPIELTLSTWTQGDNKFYSGVIRDITQRKEHEAQLDLQQTKLLEKTEELEKLYEEVSSKNDQLQGLSNKLAKYLSRQVYTSIFEGDKDVKIESYRKKLTIFFSDIEGFTELAERVESEVLTAALNKYLNEMAKIAIDFGGTIDKYIGDAIMIFFGDPDTLGEKEDAIACVKMAIEMRRRLIEMRKEWGEMGISKPLSIRMGINTGFCTVGNFGSEERLDYTIVGGAVNLASRLESAAEVNSILISEDTFSLIKEDIHCEYNKKVTVKGIPYPVDTYTVMDALDTIEEEKKHLEAQLKGFNLSIDFNKLDYADKIYAKEMLQKAMSKL